MADYTYYGLKKKTVAEMRAIAKGLDHEAIKGYSQLNKAKLLPALCAALGIEAHEHHEVVGGFDKAAAKAKMRELKAARAAALEAHDAVALKAVRRHLHSLNHQVRVHVR
ncbi:MAG: hypothetical protein QF463_01845 [Vicinamibacterales bacterium]|jgi:hypothetical protein|nr:hypothetical protein [Acidobacteriota bacterium]MDP6373827.1 hypothetical protein [Vicinamibacterales bacterium]MDP6607787.1 hypothetical protein [Vicinamibacterales bacterium]HAK55131.1 hypothetical protein [Acidobacteriota bacterium]|tara:strand:+ start:8916 stop:9245 length:330 start_codon:yes stop_codon:yes gene_type:complete